MKKEKKEKHFLHKPVFPGGIKAMRKLLKDHLRYPEEAQKKKLEGTVHLRYTINHLGKVIEAKVVSGLGLGCDEEAVRLVKLFKFEAPKNRKLKVLFHKTIQIHFRLPKTEVRAQPKAPSTAPAITYEYVPKKEVQPETKTGEEASGYTYTVEW